MNIKLEDSATTGPIYAQVRDQIQVSIQNKQLGVGENLPSPASLAQTLAVDKGEIQRAYYELEFSGLVKRTTSTDFLGFNKTVYQVK